MDGKKYIITLSKHVLAVELLTIDVPIGVGIVGLHKILSLKISQGGNLSLDRFLDFIE